jgi:autotransporter-associated beta strand protein
VIRRIGNAVTFSSFSFTTFLRPVKLGGVKSARSSRPRRISMFAAARCSIVVVAAIVVAAVPVASAQTWTGTTNGNWSNPGNWSSLPMSGNNTQLLFGAATTTAMTNDVGPFTLNQMTFNADDPTYTLSGNTLFFQAANGGGVQPTFVMNSNNAVTIGDAISYSSALTVQGTGTGTVTLNGAISGGLGPLNYQGAGMLVLGGANTYIGGTVITSGTLVLANAAAVPAGGSVNVAAGATLNTGGYSNTAATAISTLTVTGGTVRVPTGTSDFYVNQLAMTGGAVDATGSTIFGLHLVNSGAAVTINAGSSSWIGGTSHIQNDTTGPLTITANGSLIAGIALSSAGTNPNFTLTGSGSVRLANTGNTANITANGVTVFSNDLSTDVGAGAFGTLGTGTFALTNAAVLKYDGATATCAKPFSLDSSTIAVINSGVILTLSGVVGQSTPGSSLQFLGPVFAGNMGSGTLTVLASNSRTGPIYVYDQGVLAISTIGNGGMASPIGASSNTVTNINLGAVGNSARGDLLLTGTNGVYSTDRGVTVSGLYGTGGGAIGVQNAATALTWNGQITGSGSFIKIGAGTLVLTNTTNNYSGGAYIEGGTLAIGASGAVLPVGSNVTVQPGATLSLNGMYNQAASAIGMVTLNSGTIAIPSGANDYYLNQLTMTNGTVNFAGSTDYHLHFVNANAEITINAGTSNWVGSGTSRIQNDTGNALTINVDPNGMLNAGILLATGGLATDFILSATSGGHVKLTNPGNTANLVVFETTLRVDDVTSGPSGNGALGAGSLTLTGGTLVYGGPVSATLAKPIAVGVGTITNLSGGTVFTIAGAITGAGTNPGTVEIAGTLDATNTGVVALTGANTYTGGVLVGGFGILSVSAIPNGGSPGPLGMSTSDPGNILLGSIGRGTLLYTGPTATTNRGIEVNNYTDAGIFSATTGGGVIDVANANSTLTISGQVTGGLFGPGTLFKAGAGTLVLSNVTNNYNGGTVVVAGTLAAGANNVLPGGGSITVNAGALLDLGTFSISGSAALGTVALNGGTVHFSRKTQLQALNLTGGTVTGTNLTGSMDLFSPIGIVSNPSAVTSTVTFSPSTPLGFISNQSSGAMSIQVAAGSTPIGVDLDLLAPLNGANSNNPMFVKTGAGVLRLNDPNSTADLIVNQGKLRVDSIAALGSGALSLAGGTLQYGGPTTSTAKAITLDAASSGVEVMQAGTTLTLTSPITGGGGLTIRGPGTLVLPTGSTYAGGTTVDGVAFSCPAESTLGAPSGPVSIINAGLLVYTTSATTNRTFSIDTGGTLQIASGQTLTLIGGRVNGGFLRGPGALAVTGGTSLTGLTTYPSAPISVIGPAAFTNFSNGGPLTIAAGLPTATAMTGFTNQGSGLINLGAASSLNVSDFQSYGTLTVNPGTVGSGQFTVVTNVGSSPMYFNGGSRGFIGTPATANQNGQPTFVAGIDLNGQNAVVTGGLLVNNGFVVDSSSGGAGTATIIADYGSLVKGAGFYQNPVVTQNGGRVQAGNSPGFASFGRFVFGPGGVSNYVFAIDDATGAAGPNPDALGHVSGWGLLKAVRQSVGSITTSGDFTWTATPTDRLTVAIDTLVNPTTVGTDVPGLMANFDPTRSYSWLAAQWTGGYAGPNDVAALNAATTFDAGGFANPIAGTFGWSLNPPSHTLSLVYTPSAVPEPGTLMLVGAATFGFVGWHLRGRQNSCPRSDDRHSRRPA